MATRSGLRERVPTGVPTGLARHAQVGHWELAEEVDPRKALYVTGDVNVGRDPANVNIWCARNDSKLQKAS